MKKLDDIYKEQHNKAKSESVDRIDYRSEIEIIYEAIYDYVPMYLELDGKSWTLSEAIKEFIYMDLTDKEKIVATKCVLGYFQYNGNRNWLNLDSKFKRI